MGNQSQDFREVPADYDAEESVLGAMMLSEEATDSVVLILDKGDFYRESNGKLFQVIKDLREKKIPPDMVTLSSELRRLSIFDEVGGIAKLTSLVERVPTAAHAEYYAQIVKDKSSTRRLIKAGTSIVTDAYLDFLPVRELMDEAERKIFEATERKETKGFKQIKDIIGDVFEEVYETIGSENSVTGLSMGIARLDTLTRGLQPAKLYIVGARPGVGKTALAVNILWNVGSGEGSPTGEKVPVGIFSIEMTEKEIGERLLCAVSGVDFSAAQEGRVLDRDRMKLQAASARIFEAPIFVNDNSSLTILELKACARRLVKDHGVKLLVVDYLQLIRAGVHKDNREQEISYISMTGFSW